MSQGRTGIVAELTLGSQSWSSRTSHFYDDEIARRESRGTVLAGYGFAPRRWSLDLLSGISVTRADTRGMARVKEGLAPFAGRHPIADWQLTLGFTAGVDLVKQISDEFSVILPVRITHSFGKVGPTSPTTPPSRADIHAGVGLSWKVVRRVH